MLSSADGTSFTHVSNLEERAQRDFILALAKALADFGARPHRAIAVLNKTLKQSFDMPPRLLTVTLEPRALQITCANNDGESVTAYSIEFEHPTDLRCLRKIRKIQKAAISSQMHLLDAIRRLEALESQRNVVLRLTRNTYTLLRTPRIVYEFCRL
jgi:uncharacterized membrane protein YjjP (DUF1212 family)